MLVLACIGYNLFDLGRSDVFCKYATHSHTFPVNLEHDLRCAFVTHTEVFLQDDHDEIHRGEIVVEQEHLVERGTANARAPGFQYSSVLFLGRGHDAGYFNPARLP